MYKIVDSRTGETISSLRFADRESAWQRIDYWMRMRTPRYDDSSILMHAMPVEAQE